MPRVLEKDECKAKYDRRNSKLYPLVKSKGDAEYLGYFRMYQDEWDEEKGNDPESAQKILR